MFGVILLMLGATEITCSYIFYAEGTFKLLNAEFSCVNSATITKNQQFPGTFKNTPKIIIYPTKYSMGYQQSGYNLYYNPFKTSFDVIIQCLDTKYRIDVFFFKWVAVDDSRIRVLNYTLDVTPDSGIGQNVYSHDLTNAKVGFTTFTHFTTSRPVNQTFNFTIQVKSVTSNDVTLSYEGVGSVNQFMRTLGIQIIIGTEAALQPLQTVALSRYYQQQLISKSLQYTILLGINYFNFNSDYLQFEITNVETDKDITLKIDSNYCAYCQYLYLKVVAYKQYEVDSPLLCSKMRIAKKKQTFAVPFQVYLQVNGDTTTTQTFQSAFHQIVKTMAGEYNTLDLIVSLKCNFGQRIKGQVLKCIDCKKQNHDLSTICYGGIDFVEYHIRLFQKDQVNQQVTFDITQSKFQMIQLVKGTQDKILLSIELQS